MIFPGRSPSRFAAGPVVAAATPSRPANLWSATRLVDEAAARNEEEEQSHYVRGHRLPVLIASVSDIRGSDASDASIGALS